MLVNDFKNLAQKQYHQQPKFIEITDEKNICLDNETLRANKENINYKKNSQFKYKENNQTKHKEKKIKEIIEKIYKKENVSLQVMQYKSNTSYINNKEDNIKSLEMNVKKINENLERTKKLGIKQNTDVSYFSSKFNQLERMIDSSNNKKSYLYKKVKSTNVLKNQKEDNFTLKKSNSNVLTTSYIKSQFMKSYNIDEPTKKNFDSLLSLLTIAKDDNHGTASNKFTPVFHSNPNNNLAINKNRNFSLPKLKLKEC